MRDRQESFGGSLIQHGKYSDRIYLMQVAAEDVPGILAPLDQLALTHGYGKIFAKVPARLRPAFTEAGYVSEAVIPGFFQGPEDGHFMAKYFSRARSECREEERIGEILKACTQRGPEPDRKPPGGFRFRQCRTEEIPKLAALFGATFPSYPFPVHDPDYLHQTMRSHVDYYGAWQGDELAAVASAEQTSEEGHVEMTDFATRQAFRRQGLASGLLEIMEREMRLKGFRIAYTIARALSAGMNFTFARRGYRLAGTLINNTQIGGRIECMNVWYKDLQSG